MGTDPTPYIMLAYGVGFGFMGGYTIWTILARRKLRVIARTLNIKEGA